MPLVRESALRACRMLIDPLRAALCTALLAVIAGCVSAPPAPAPLPAPVSRLEKEAPETPKHAPVNVEAESTSGNAPDQHVAPQADREAFASRVLEAEAGHRLSAEEREHLARTLVRAEAESGIPLVLTIAIMKQESRFNPTAKGPSGSIGLMQLQLATAREVAEKAALGPTSKQSLFDPNRNVRIGLAYLAEMREKFGSIEHAVAAYNIGPKNLRRLLRRGPLRRGPYLTKIYNHVDALHTKYGQ